MREDGTTKDALAQWAIYGLAQVVAIIALDGLIRRTQIHFLRLDHELYLLQGSRSGELIHQGHVERYAILLRLGYAGSPHVQQTLSVFLHKNDTGMAVGNDSGSLMTCRGASHLGVQSLFYSLF